MHRWDPLLQPFRSSISSRSSSHATKFKSKSKSKSKHKAAYNDTTSSTTLPPATEPISPPLPPKSSLPPPSFPAQIPKPSKRVRFAEDFTPSSLKLKIVCGPRHDPSLVICVKLGFEVGGVPRLGFKIRHPREHRDRGVEDGAEDATREADSGDEVGEGKWLGTEKRAERVGRELYGGMRRAGAKGSGRERGRERYRTEERWPEGVIVERRDDESREMAAGLKRGKEVEEREQKKW